MADEGGGHAGLAVDLLLEREDEQHVVDGAADRLDALGTPGPDRGAHEVNGRNAAAAQLLLDGEVEVGSVDAHKHLRHRVAEAGDEVLAEAQQARQVREHFDIAAHGKLARVVPGAKARGAHLVAAHAVLRSTAHACGHLRNHKARDEVAARLAGKPDSAVAFKRRNGRLNAHEFPLVDGTVRSGENECAGRISGSRRAGCYR